MEEKTKREDNTAAALLLSRWPPDGSEEVGASSAFSLFIRWLFTLSLGRCRGRIAIRNLDNESRRKGPTIRVNVVGAALPTRAK